MTTVTRRFRPELPEVTGSLAPCPTMIREETGTPVGLKKSSDYGGPVVRQRVVRQGRTRRRREAVDHRRHCRPAQLRQERGELGDGAGAQGRAVVGEQHRRRDGLVHPVLAQAGRDQCGELRAGHLRPDHGGLGRARRQQVRLGGAGRGRSGQERGDHEDRVPGQLARGRTAGQVAGVQHDHAAGAEDVAVLLLEAGQGAGGGRALREQAVGRPWRVGQLAEPWPGARDRAATPMRVACLGGLGAPARGDLAPPVLEPARRTAPPGRWSRPRRMRPACPRPPPRAEEEPPS